VPGGDDTHIPILCNEALFADLPREGRAAVAKHTIHNFSTYVQCEDVFQVEARAVSDAAHLFYQWHPRRLLEGREELDGFEADLRPGKLGGAHEHAFVEGYAAMDLGAGGEAVLVADLEVEWLMSRAHGENESVQTS
jgi:hypothetical protein